MVIKHFIFLLLPLLLMYLTGCGLLYTSVVRQHSKDFNKTPVGSKTCSHTAYTVRVPLLPLTTSRIQAQWDISIIRTLAEEAGIKKVYFTDVKTQEFLLGTFRRSTIIIYGD